MNKTNTLLKLVGVFMVLLCSFMLKAQSPSICGTLPNTGSNHTVVLDINRFAPKLNGQPLPLGSYIVLQYAKTNGTLSCAGFALWNNTTTAISANGDDETTSADKEGYSAAEAFKFAVVLGDGTVITNDKIVTEFAPISGIISNGNGYAVNGISALIKLDITTLTCTTLRDTIRTNTCIAQLAGTRIDTFKTTANCDSIVVKIATFRNSDTTRLSGTTCIQSQTGVFTTRLTNRFGCDSIVIKTVTFNPSDTTRLNGTTCIQSQTGVFTTRLTNRFGCDSIVIKTVTFNPSDTTRLSGTTCIQSQTGVFTTRLTNRFGCDSIVIKTVTFNPSDTTRLSGTTCIQSQTGVFTTRLTNRFGCDSIVIKTVTFNPSDTIRLSSTTCIQSQTGVFTTRLTNRFGCDSIVIKTVTFNPSDTTRLSGTTCIQSQTGVFTTRLTNRFGCDSIVIKTVTFNPSDTTRLSGTTCIQSQTGVFTTRLTNRFGCDSIVIKTVTFNPSDTTRLSGTTCIQSQTGVFTTRLTNRFGCDSIVIKTVTFNPSDTTRLSGTTCIQSQTGVFTTRLTNRFGCDSIVIKTVTFNPSDTTRLSGTTCIQSQTGVFTTKLTNRFGCDSVIIRTVTYRPATKPTITRSNDTLTSTLALAYQWYRNDTLLIGATNRTYKALVSANYKVEITDVNGCTMKSDAIAVTISSVYNCPILQKNIGDACDDGNPNTTNDKVQSNCTCSGTLSTGILTVNCPPNIGVIAAVGQTSVIVNYNAPTATSTCPIGMIKVTPSSTNPASGTAFPIGTKTLSFTASDGCGNTKTCSFTITVVGNSNPCTGDVTKPIAKCKTMTVYLNPSGKATISGSDINNGSTDNCSTALSFAVSPNTFDCSKIGSNTVILTATDAASNNSTCSTIVNVSDNSAPVFSKCPANISLTTPNSCASATWTNPIVTDNCGTPSVSSNYNSGYCFSIGSKSVVYTATDAKGNKATCNFTVTVTAANTCTNVFSSNKCYKIVNKKSGKLLDVYGALKVNNTPIIQWNANNGANQKWRFISVGSGYVKIVAQNSGKEVACHRTTNNSLVYQYDYAPGGAKDWKIECVNNSGYYKITHRLSGKVLDVKNGSSTDGQNIVISNFNANNNSQLWQIVEVTCPTQTYNLASSTIFDINGQAEFDRNRISFTTNQGFRTDFFTVEKQEKVSGQFEPLEILNNKQADNNAQYNTVYDNSPYQGDNFYRVKMTYLSGDFDYSAIQKIVNTQKADFVIFPNPASNEAWIDLKSFEGRTIDILMSDVAGKVLRYEKIDKATAAPYRLDLTDIQSGSYLLTIQTKGKRAVVGKLSILK